MKQGHLGMISLINHDSSEGEQGLVVIKFTQMEWNGDSRLKKTYHSGFLWFLTQSPWTSQKATSPTPPLNKNALPGDNEFFPRVRYPKLVASSTGS